MNLCTTIIDPTTNLESLTTKNPTICGKKFDCRESFQNHQKTHKVDELDDKPPPEYDVSIDAQMAGINPNLGNQQHHKEAIDDLKNAPA